MDNYQFCAGWAHGKVLDYGCGAGHMVSLMRARGLDAWGCDVFYEGGDSRRMIGADVAPYLVEMNSSIPFPDATFDCVVSNTVLEHVPNLNATVAEIKRVIRPGGKSLHLFPHLECWREGHCEIPFLHRVPRSARAYYAAAFRAIGLGANHGDKSVMQWSRDFAAWLDAWTHYRPLAEIRGTFERHVRKAEFIEHEWLSARLPTSRHLPSRVRQVVARKLAGLVVVLHH